MRQPEELQTALRLDGDGIPSMALTELQIVAGVITALTLALLAVTVKVWWPKKVDEEEASLDAMINGFDFELPEEVDQYRQFKEEHPDDVDACFQALFRRAVADIPLIRKIQSESAGIQRLKKNDILKDGSFLSYKMAEVRTLAPSQRECGILMWTCLCRNSSTRRSTTFAARPRSSSQVRTAAHGTGGVISTDTLRLWCMRAGEGWPDRIFPQAVQFMNHMAEQQMMAQRKAAEQQMQAMQAQMQAQQEGEEEEEEEAAEEIDGDAEGLRKRK
jgi:hypothetical protein